MSVERDMDFRAEMSVLAEEAEARIAQELERRHQYNIERVDDEAREYAR